MSRFFERHRAFDIAATLLVVLLAVSVADIDDYDMQVAGMRSCANISMTRNATADISSATSDSGSDSDHVCSCLLCVMTLTDSLRPRVPTPSPGKLPTPVVAGIARSPHLSEVFHPPSA